MKLRTLLFLLLSIFTALPLVGYQIFHFQDEKEELYNSTVAKLKDVATLQHRRIKTILAHYKIATSLVKSRTQFRKLLASANSPIQNQLQPENQTQVSEILQHAKDANPFIQGIAVYTVDAQPYYSDMEALNKAISPDDFAANNNGYKVSILTADANRYLTFSEHLMLNQTLIGYITIAYSLDELISIVSDYTGLDETGEIVLATRTPNGDAQFLTPTRHDPSVAMSLTVPKENLKIPITHAINGVNDVFPDYVDYRNEPVLAISHHIPEVDWGMIVKVDKSETYQNLELIKQRSFKTLATTLLAVVLASLALANWAARPYLTIQQALTANSTGDKVKISQHSKIKEIEQVTNAFNHMVDKLDESESYLHSSIRELTDLNQKLDAESMRFHRWKESNFIGIIHSDADGHIIDANTTLLDMIGYTEEELKNNQIDWKNLTPKEYLHLDIKAVEEANEKGFWTPFEKVYTHKDGHDVPILIGGSLFKEDSQEFIVFVVNLSENYKQKRELEEYKGIIENSRDMFAFVDVNYEFKTVNQAYLNLHNKQRHEIIGKKVPDIVGHEFFNNKLKKRVDRALNGEVVSFQEDTSKILGEVKTLKVSYIPYKNQSNEIVGFIFKGEDISELKLKQKTIDLKDAERKRIIESMLEGILTVNSKGEILSFNREAENIFGYSEKEVLGKSIDMLTDGVRYHDKKIQNFLKTGTSEIINNRLGRDIPAKRKDGSIFPIRIAVANMPVNENGEIQFIANFQDMSEQERQTKLLNRSLKLESLGNIAGGVAHDFNNILGIILGFTELLQEELQDKTSCINAIEKACSRGQNLTSNLLTFAKKNNSSAIDVNLNKLIEKNEKLLQTAMTSKISLALNLGQNVQLVHIEENLFEDLLLNMSINAMHAMPNGGQLTITTQTIDIPLLRAESLGLTAGKYVKISLTDTGHGISAENLDKIFDPFFTTKANFGNGLGLAQCYGFINSSKGVIDVNSQEGVETTFNIYLPAVTTSETELENDSVSNVSMLPKSFRKVLILDDEEDFRHLVQQFFAREENIVTFTAATPKQAMELLISNPVDLIISDVIMPDVGGVEFIEQATAILPTAKYLFITGYIDSNQNGKIDKSCVLYKPFSKESLFRKIKDIFDA